MTTPLHALQPGVMPEVHGGITRDSQIGKRHPDQNNDCELANEVRRCQFLHANYKRAGNCCQDHVENVEAKSEYREESANQNRYIFYAELLTEL